MLSLSKHGRGALRGLALALGLALLSSEPAWAGCGSGQVPSSDDVSLIRWSTYCFVGGDQGTLVLLERLVRPSGFVDYDNWFRGRYGVPLIGTYTNVTPKLFAAALKLIQDRQLESIRLHLDYYLDGCAGYLMVTRCNATLVISELQMDMKDPEYVKLDRALHDLNALAAGFDWTKESDDRRIVPLMLADPPNPSIGP